MSIIADCKGFSLVKKKKEVIVESEVTTRLMTKEEIEEVFGNVDLKKKGPRPSHGKQLKVLLKRSKSNVGKKLSGNYTLKKSFGRYK